MNPIFNTKNMFYDYFPHLPAIRMKKEFGLGFFEQSVIRNEIQSAICRAYDQLVASHDLVHANVYGEIGDEFDEKFYLEFKDNLRRHFHDNNSWNFLDNLLKKNSIDNAAESENFNTRLQASIGYSVNRNRQGKVNLREALVALLNHDLDLLNGRELLYLTKIK